MDLLVEAGAKVNLASTEVGPVCIDLQCPTFASLKKSGDVPLGIAAHNGHARTVDRLLQAKANVNWRNKVMTVHSLTTTAVTILKNLLHRLVALILMASLKGHVEIVRLLIDKKANVNVCNKVFFQTV